MDNLRKQIQTKDRPYTAPKGAGIENAQPLSWDQFYDQKVLSRSGLCVYMAGTTGPLCMLFHGAGLGALSWAVVVKLLKVHCRIICYDCRGHGDSTLSEDDMASQTLINDANSVLEEFFPEETSLVLVGHSMGGAIAIRTALALPKGKVSGLVVLDVVEGTAMAALPKMMNVLQARPQKFDTPSSAISWAISSGTVRNQESARVSLPQQIIEKEGQYIWRTDLRKTQTFWKGWFEDMSNLFLSVPAPKLLILADTDRLDTALTTGQMMGRFQMSILPSVGHLIQEDAPEKTAMVVLNFLQRFGLCGK